MNQYNPFYISKVYKIISLVFGLVFTGLGCWGFVYSLLESINLNTQQATWSLVIQLVIVFYISFGSLWVGIKFFSRFNYFSVTVVLDDINKRIVYTIKNKVVMVNYSDIDFIKDCPNKQILVLTNRVHKLIIPKEIQGYLNLFFLLQERGIYHKPINVSQFKTTVGLIQRILIFILIPVCLFSFREIGGDVYKYYAVVKQVAISFVILMLLLISLNNYHITDFGIISSNVVFQRHIAFSNIKTIKLDESRKQLTVYLIHDPIRKFRKLVGSEGVVIREPGNISLEHLYVELNKKIKQ